MVKNKKMIKKDILGKFKELEMKEDKRLPVTWLQNDYFRRLNTIERKTFNKAVAELASRGLVEYKHGACPEVKLTRLGEHLIYS